MLYEPPKQPVQEAGPVLVTPLAKVPPGRAVNVDCPYCQKVVKTEIREIESGDDGYVRKIRIVVVYQSANYLSSMMKCLICLVCWPMLFCYEGNKDTDHHCSVCKRKLTHQPNGTGMVSVVAETNPQPELVPSKYEQSS